MRESEWAVDAFGAKSTERGGPTPKDFSGTSSATDGALDDQRCTRKDSVRARKPEDIPTEYARFDLERTVSPTHCDASAVHPRSPAVVRECAAAGDSGIQPTGELESNLCTNESKSSTS